MFFLDVAADEVIPDALPANSEYSSSNGDVCMNEFVCPTSGYSADTEYCLTPAIETGCAKDFDCATHHRCNTRAPGRSFCEHSVDILPRYSPCANSNGDICEQGTECRLSGFSAEEEYCLEAAKETGCAEDYECALDHHCNKHSPQGAICESAVDILTQNSALLVQRW